MNRLKVLTGTVPVIHDKGIVSSNPNNAQKVDGVDLGEIRAVRLENRARRLHHHKIRTIYDGKKINKKYL